MLTVKAIHVFCAYTTGLGFLLRGALVLLKSPIVQHRLTKTLPHIIDSGLLVSGLVMVISWSLSPLSQHWLLAKILALFLYIGFGLLMLRWGDTERNRWVGLIGGLLVYLYIVAAAHSKSAMSFLQFF